MWQPLTGCNGDNRCNLRGGDMFFVGDHYDAKVGQLNGKTKKGQFINGNRVILGLR